MSLFQLSTAKNEINVFMNHVLIVAPVTFAPTGATPRPRDSGFNFILLFPFVCNFIPKKYNVNPLTAKTIEKTPKMPQSRIHFGFDVI